MNFKVAPDAFQKLSLLGDATEFEPAGANPSGERSIPLHHRNNSLPCISQVATPHGRKPIVKAMMTTACERNCFYCPFRAGRSKTKRITFSPDEMASATMQLIDGKVADGLFLSSGIIKGSVTSQDKINTTAHILRRKYHYRGYIHLKIMPGAEYEQVREAMRLADRVSVNLEGPTPERLMALAPKKDYWGELMTRLKWISNIQRRERFPTSTVTQFVVGAVDETDLELLQVSEGLLQRMGIRRTYFSSFRPIEQTPFDALSPSPALRELRLYQASFLLRDYGFQLEEMPFTDNGRLSLQADPKRLWAEANLADRPIEINNASQAELLRIPGIGPLSARTILTARTQATLNEPSQLRQLGLRDVAKALPYILLNGKRPAQQLSLL